MDSRRGGHARPRAERGPAQQTRARHSTAAAENVGEEGASVLPAPSFVTRVVEQVKTPNVPGHAHVPATAGDSGVFGASSLAVAAPATEAPQTKRRATAKPRPVSSSNSSGGALSATVPSSFPSTGYLSAFDLAVLSALRLGGGSAMVAPLGAAIPRALRGPMPFTEQLAGVPGTRLSKAVNGTITIELIDDEHSQAGTAGTPGIPMSSSRSARLRGDASATSASSSSPSSFVQSAPPASAKTRIVDQCSGGYLFQSSAATHHECLSRMLLGAPASATAGVLALRPRASVLFLYCGATRNVIGTLTPAAPPGLLLEPGAWASHDKPSPFPAQVRACDCSCAKLAW